MKNIKEKYLNFLRNHCVGYTGNIDMESDAIEIDEEKKIIKLNYAKITPHFCLELGELDIPTHNGTIAKFNDNFSRLIMKYIVMYAFNLFDEEYEIHLHTKNTYNNVISIIHYDPMNEDDLKKYNMLSSLILDIILIYMFDNNIECLEHLFTIITYKSIEDKFDILFEIIRKRASIEFKSVFMKCTSESNINDISL